MHPLESEALGYPPVALGGIPNTKENHYCLLAIKAFVSVRPCGHEQNSTNCRGLGAKKGRQSLEAVKGKKQNPPLESPEET